MPDTPQFYDNTDWMLLRRMQDLHPDQSKQIKSLGDEMDHYQKVGFAILRGENRVLPPRPDLTIRLNEICPKLMTEESSPTQ